MGLRASLLKLEICPCFALLPVMVMWRGDWELSLGRRRNAFLAMGGEISSSPAKVGA
ncbi:MAG: hypothetical protein RL095_1836 [Verrucomicrobiota bacterium]|jgi:hypothetical protein